MSDVYFSPIDKCWTCGVSTLNKTEEEFDVSPFWCSEEHESEWRKKITPTPIPDDKWYDEDQNGTVINLNEDKEGDESTEYKCPHERNCKAHREICMVKFGFSEIAKRK